MEADWFPATLLSSTHKGRYYDIPRDGFPMSLFAWNRVAFSEAGLDPDQPPTTMEQVDAINPKLLRLDPDGRAIKAGYVPYAGFLGRYGAFWSLLWGSNFWDNERHEFTANARRNVEAMEWLKSHAQRLNPLLNSSWLKGSSWGVTGFANGNLAMAMVASSDIPSLTAAGMTTSTVGIEPLPSAPGSDRHRVYMAGEGFAIPKSAKHPEAAWEVLAWLMKKEQSQHFAERTGIPPARISSFRYFMDRVTDGLYLQMLNATFNSEVVAVPGTPLDGQAIVAMSQAEADVVALKKSPQGALDEVQQVLAAKMQEYVNKNGPWW